MKKKILSITLLGILVLGVSVAVNAKSRNKYNRNVSSNNYIGVNRAMNIALKKVPGANQSHFGKIELDHDHGRAVYEIEIFYNNSKYEFDIDASTGEIIGTQVKHYNKNY